VASTAANPIVLISVTGSAWIMFPARRSGCQSHDWQQPKRQPDDSYCVKRISMVNALMRKCVDEWTSDRCPVAREAYFKLSVRARPGNVDSK
jgi:hypothetical protein